MNKDVQVKIKLGESHKVVDTGIDLSRLLRLCLRSKPFCITLSTDGWRLGALCYYVFMNAAAQQKSRVAQPRSLV
jgi:hypothetical protein